MNDLLNLSGTQGSAVKSGGKDTAKGLRVAPKLGFASQGSPYKAEGVARNFAENGGNAGKSAYDSDGAAFAKMLERAAVGSDVAGGAGKTAADARAASANPSATASVAAANTAATATAVAANTATDAVDGKLSEADALKLIADTVDELGLDAVTSARLKQVLGDLYKKTLELNPDVSTEDLIGAITDKLADILSEFIKSMSEKRGKEDFSGSDKDDSDKADADEDKDGIGAYIGAEMAGIGDLIAAAVMLNNALTAGQDATAARLISQTADHRISHEEWREVLSDTARQSINADLLPKHSESDADAAVGQDAGQGGAGVGDDSGVVLPADDEFLSAAKSIVNEAVLRNVLDGKNEDLFGTSFGERNDVLSGAADASDTLAQTALTQTETLANALTDVSVGLSADVDTADVDAALPVTQTDADVTAAVVDTDGKSDAAEQDSERDNDGERDESGQRGGAKIIDLSELMSARATGTAALAQTAGRSVTETPRETLTRYITNQVAEVVEARLTPLTNGVSEFTLTLNPRQMGRITINLVTEGNSVSVSITAENAETHALLATRGEHLGSVLNKNGAELVKYEVTHAEQGQQGQNRQNQDNGEFREQGQRGGNGGTRESEADGGDNADYGFAGILDEVSAAQAV